MFQIGGAKGIGEGKKKSGPGKGGGTDIGEGMRVGKSKKRTRERGGRGRKGNSIFDGKRGTRDGKKRKQRWVYF